MCRYGEKTRNNVVYFCVLCFMWSQKSLDVCGRRCSEVQINDERKVDQILLWLDKYFDSGFVLLMHTRVEASVGCNKWGKRRTCWSKPHSVIFELISCIQEHCKPLVSTFAPQTMQSYQISVLFSFNSVKWKRL